MPSWSRHAETPHGKAPTSRRTPKSALTFNPQLRQHERVFERGIAQGIIAATLAIVAGGLQIHLEQERMGIGPGGAKFGHVLRRLPVHYLAVVERRLHQHR